MWLVGVNAIGRRHQRIQQKSDSPRELRQSQTWESNDTHIEKLCPERLMSVGIEKPRTAAGLANMQIDPDSADPHQNANTNTRICCTWLSLALGKPMLSQRDVQLHDKDTRDSTVEECEALKRIREQT
jgi:hypothetical protein